MTYLLHYLYGCWIIHFNINQPKHHICHLRKANDNVLSESTRRFTLNISVWPSTHNLLLPNITPSRKQKIKFPLSLKHEVFTFGLNMKIHRQQCNANKSIQSPSTCPIRHGNAWIPCGSFSTWKVRMYEELKSHPVQCKNLHKEHFHYDGEQSDAILSLFSCKYKVLFL